MKIYTKTGDRGQTSLFNGTRVAKNTLRVETYGTVDELNSFLGVILAFIEDKNTAIKIFIQGIQADLLQLGALLANPTSAEKEKEKEYFKKRTEDIEKEIDKQTKEIEPLTRFILPGGSRVGSLLQFSRTICRRLERLAVGLSQKEEVEKEALIYLNRLSDLLFTMSRFVNHKEGKEEIIWNKKI